MNVNILILYRKPTNPVENQAEEICRHSMEERYKCPSILTGIEIPSQPEDLKIKPPEYYFYQVDNKMFLF